MDRCIAWSLLLRRDSGEQLAPADGLSVAERYAMRRLTT